MDIALTAFEKLGPNLPFDYEFHDNSFLMDALLNLHIRYKDEFCPQVFCSLLYPQTTSFVIKS